MTSIETGPTWSERLDPRNWTLAWKLLLVGLVPALLALTLGVLRISDLTTSAASYGATQRFIAVQGATSKLIGDLQAERDQAVIVAAGRRDQPALAALNSAEAAVDDSNRALTADLANRTGLSPAIIAAQLRVQQGLVALPGLRSAAQAGTLPAAQTISGYSSAIAPLLGFNTVVVVEQLDAVSRSGDGRAAYSLAIYGLTGAREQIALQQAAMNSAIVAGTLSDPVRSTITTAAAQLNAGLQEVGNNPDPELRQRLGTLANDPAFGQRQQLLNQLLAPGPLPPVDLTTWNDANQRLLTAVNSLETEVRDSQSALVAQQVATAQNLAGINSVLLMLILLLAATITILVARGLIRSLRLLRTAVLDVAERKLPQTVASMQDGGTPDVRVDPVPITTRDDVGQVARAFDALHGQAVRLAADQAALRSNVGAMFVNLSRRSQALVERQLQLIERLESNEQDADQLANLFQLDHLATRMRRNSENLLVLAGTDLARRNAAPVPMVDILRAAVSEVEQYQRIVVQSPPTVSIVGRAGSDLVHLLAELLDNASNFSPPDSQVVMSTTRTSDGSIIVEIVDRGVGMIDDELSDANQRLSGPSGVDVAASRRMGLFVVGRLGARHGIGVRLSTSAAGVSGVGLTASVTIPPYLVPAGQPAESDIRASAAVPAQGGREGVVQPQRANGTSRPGSLSALVAGTDGPANPVGVFDAPDRAAFGTTGTNGGSHSGGPLPNRQPGSALRPEGGQGPRPPKPGPSDDLPSQSEGPAQQADERHTREVAEQARRDQELAAERERATAAERHATDENKDEDEDTGPDVHASNGDDATLNDSPTQAFPAVIAEPAVANAQDGESGDRTPEDRRQRTDPQRTDPQRTDLQRRADPSGPPAPPPAGPHVVSPPTTPMAVVRPAGYAAGPPPVPPAPAGFPRRRTEELFEPSAPNGTEAGRAAAEAQAGFERGETTPIFEEIASAWFRSNRPVPVNWVTENGDDEPQASVQAPAAAATPPAATPPAATPPAATPPAATPPEVAQSEMPHSEGAPSEMSPSEMSPSKISPSEAPPSEAPQRVAGSQQPSTPQPLAPRPPAPRPVAPRPVAPRPVVRPTPVPIEADRVESGTAALPAAPLPAAALPVAGAAFAGAADEGWRAANEIESDHADELTSAGLPKRRPRARLVPGSAGSAVLSPPVTTSRSAETIRGRLASYQQGVRQAREARSDDGSAVDRYDTSTNHEEKS